MRHILKVGFAVIENNRLLLVRKRGLASLILPGGKHKEGEDDRTALIREIGEELGCGVELDSLSFLGEFMGRFAYHQHMVVQCIYDDGSCLHR